jgi:hypothetical protein
LGKRKLIKALFAVEAHTAPKQKNEILLQIAIPPDKARMTIVQLFTFSSQELTKSRLEQSES